MLQAVNNVWVQTSCQTSEYIFVLLLERLQVREEIKQRLRTTLLLFNERINHKNKVVIKVNVLRVVHKQEKQWFDVLFNYTHCFPSKICVFCNKADNVDAGTDKSLSNFNNLRFWIGLISFYLTFWKVQCFASLGRRWWHWWVLLLVLDHFEFAQDSRYKGLQEIIEVVQGKVRMETFYKFFDEPEIVEWLRNFVTLWKSLNQVLKVLDDSLLEMSCFEVVLEQSEGLMVDDSVGFLVFVSYLLGYNVNQPA